MGRAVLSSASDYSDPYISLAARRVTGADLFFLGRKINTCLANLVLAVVTHSIVSGDMAFLALCCASTTQVAERETHPGELAVLTDVAACSVNFLRGDWNVVEKLVREVARPLMHTWRFMRDHWLPLRVVVTWVLVVPVSAHAGLKLAWLSPSNLPAT